MDPEVTFGGQVTPPADVAEAVLRAGDRLGPMAGRLVWYASVPSTNTVALAQAEHGADEGVVVAADAQTAGRGRLGRSWSSPAGAGIYASVLLRPSLRVVPLMTIAAGVAIADGIEASTGLRTVLKWPNDIFAGGRKLGGILAERGSTHLVIGFGLNVLDARMPAEVAVRATSISSELGRPVDRGIVFVECLAALWRRYRELEERRDRGVLDAWRARATSMMGRSIEWEHEGIVEAGRAVGVDEGGALLMDTGTRTIRIVSGEVRWD